MTFLGHTVCYCIIANSITVLLRYSICQIYICLGHTRGAGGEHKCRSLLELLLLLTGCRVPRTDASSSV